MFSKLSIIYRWYKLWGTLPVKSWVKGASCYREGKFDEAVIHYSDGLKDFPEHPARTSARIDLAYCLFKVRKFNESETELRKVIKANPNLKEAYVRLAQLQLWIGHPFEAAMTLKHGLNSIQDIELVSLFLITVLENEGSPSLMNEALSMIKNLPKENRNNRLFEVAKGMLKYATGSRLEGLEQIEKVVESESAPFEAYLYFSELLINEGRITLARQYLRKALYIRPEYPYIQSLLAKTYLAEGLNLNPEFACQLALSACQSSGWQSPREMHILAEAYRRCGDRMSALLVANKAKEVGMHILGSYRDFKNLETLIEDLSSGTLA